jgi:DNA repair exonuclease SbcCD ATPase subunit
MKLIDAEWKGFASYADVAKVTFSEGLTGIVATYADDDRKSMGAGKSTIVMTLLYALFNKGSFKSVSEVINDTYGEKDHVYVKYRFSKYGNTYTIERGLLNGAAYLDLYENDSPMGENKIASRNEEILKIVGWDYDMFTASIFFEQDKLSKLVDTDGAKRREYIEKILNTRDWTLMQEQPNKKGKKLIEDIVIKQKEIVNIEANIIKNKEELDTYVNIDENIELNQKEKAVLQETVDKLGKDIQVTKELNIVLHHKKDMYKSHDNTIKSVENSIANLATSLESANTKIRSAIEDTDRDTSSLATHKKDIVSLKFSLADIKQTTSTIMEEKTKVEKEIAVHTHEISQINSSKEAYSSGEGKCDNCEQTITQEYAETKIKEKTELIRQANIFKSSKEATAEELSKKIIENKTTKIDTLTIEVAKVEKLIAQLETQLTGYDKIHSDSTKEVEKLNKQLEGYQKELLASTAAKAAFLLELKNSFSRTINSLADFDTLIEENSNSNIEEIESTIKEAEKKIELLQSATNTLYTQKGKKEELTKVSSKYDEDKLNILLEITTLEQDVKIENMVLKGFKEIPSNLLAKNIKKIENYANEYIKKFIPYMEVCVEEDLEKSSRPIEIYYKFKDKERSYRMLSGGQKTVANLGLRLAFSKIISEKTNSISEVIVLDEPFGYLDAYSRDLVKNVLSDLQKYYRQIIVISHIDNVTEFPNIINVRMENNKSYIV